MPAASDARVTFVLEVGRALHAYGYPSPRLEDVLGTAARRLGLEAEIFSTPTSIFAGFGSAPDQKTFLLRVEPGGTDLGRLARTEEIIQRVHRGELSAEAGLREILIAAILGAVTGLLAIPFSRRAALERIFEPVAAFAVAFLAAVLAARAGGFSLATATLAGLIVLIPGMTLTTAMTELASRHLSSGTSRLSAAGITFLGIGLGVTLGYRIAELVAGAPPTGVAAPDIPSWTNLIAPAAAACGGGLRR